MHRSTCCRFTIIALSLAAVGATGYSSTVEANEHTVKGGGLSLEVLIPTPSFQGSLGSSQQVPALLFVTTKAERGDPNAQWRLSEEYQKGVLASKDLVASAYWADQAARQGHVEAQVSIGYKLEIGLGVAQDLSAARYWYLESIKQGSAAGLYRFGQLLNASSSLDSEVKRRANQRALGLFIYSGSLGNSLAEAAVDRLSRQLGRQAYDEAKEQAFNLRRLDYISLAKVISTY